MQLPCHAKLFLALCGKGLFFNKFFNVGKTAVETLTCLCGVAATVPVLMDCYIVVKNDSIPIDLLMKAKDSTELKYVKTFV